MELSALLFSLGLLLAGIWLIFTISGDFREKRRQEPRAAEPLRRNPTAARYVPPVARQRTNDNPRQPSKRAQAAATTTASDASSKSVEKTVPADPFEDLNASVIHETFERFTSESKRTR